MYHQFAAMMNSSTHRTGDRTPRRIQTPASISTILRYIGLRVYLNTPSVTILPGSLNVLRFVFTRMNRRDPDAPSATPAIISTIPSRLKGEGAITAIGHSTRSTTIRTTQITTRTGGSNHFILHSLLRNA